MLLPHVAVKMLQAGRQLAPSKPKCARGQRTFFISTASGRVHLMLQRAAAKPRTASVQHGRQGPHSPHSPLSSAVWLAEFGFLFIHVVRARRVWQQVAQAVITASMSLLLLHKLACAAHSPGNCSICSALSLPGCRLPLPPSLLPRIVWRSFLAQHFPWKHKSQITLAAAIRLPCCLVRCQLSSTAVFSRGQTSPGQPRPVQTRPHCPAGLWSLLPRAAAAPCARFP